MILNADYSLDNYPKLNSEKDDSARLERAISECEEGVLYIPKGIYSVSKTIAIENGCSLLMHPYAVINAVSRMDFVISVNCEPDVSQQGFMNEKGLIRTNINQFIQGGMIDGKGLASCLKLENYRHFTLKDCTLLNGKSFGLKAVGYYELIATNVYCKCTINGLAGNAGISSDNGDSHYTDCIVVDYTTGIEMLGGGNNRLTRCHVWGGPVPPRDTESEIPEMLENSVCFHIKAADTLMRDCYADTALTGFLIENDAKLLGCAYFHNDYFKLDNIIAIKHIDGKLAIFDCTFTNPGGKADFYDGNGNVAFRDNTFNGEFSKTAIINN